MERLKPLLGTMRLPFLILAPACVSLGVGTAYWQTGRVDWVQAGLVLLGGVTAHISVNVFNEYFDFQSGLDTRTERTPFSGGSGTLPAQPDLKGETLFLAMLSMGITAAVGVYFVWVQGWALLPLGLLGLILLVTYTVWWVFNPILCLIAPGLGFGLLMVMGTHYALTGTYSWLSFLASLVPTFLVSDLLLLNQFPDVEADQSVGREHYPILLGRKPSALIYGALLLFAYLAIAIGVILDIFPVISLLSMLTAILGWQAFQGSKRHAEDIQALVPSLGLNVIVNITTPLLLSLSLFLGRLSFL